jgi:arylformamidase
MGDGPKVYLNYDQAELDRNYDQRAWAPNADEVIKQWTTGSAAARARLKHRTGLAYGPTEDETLDLFPAARPDAPILVFIHGGAWRNLSKEDSSYAAPAFVAAGTNFVVLNFANIPKVRLPDMVAQVRRGVAWVYRNARELGGDPERLYVAGCSSGGHLTANLLVTDWPQMHDLPNTIIKGGLCVSGMYDLEPVMLSARSSYVKISKEEEADLSPARHLDRLSCPIAIAYGEKETHEFQRQARDFAAMLKPRGRLFDLVLLRGLNHFEVGSALGDPNSDLFRLAARLLKLKS